MNLEKIIKDKPRTAPGSAQPSEVTALKVFEILDLYSLSMNKTNKRKMIIKKLEVNDKKTELKVKLDKSLKSIILKLSITLYIIKESGITNPKKIGKKLKIYGNKLVFCL